MRSKLLPILLLASLAATATSPAAQPAAREPLVERVKKAIDRGVQFLRDQEKGQGNWEHIDKASVQNPGGWTCLNLLALLTAGVRPDDPIVERCLRYVRTLEPDKTYVVALQTMVFAETGRNEDRPRIQRNVDWLVAARIMDGKNTSGWTYRSDRIGMADNSNTQYAMLGLHAGHVAGAKIDQQVWESLREFYIRTQDPEGGWVYNPGRPQTPILTMTTAGLCGLLIAGLELNLGREQIRADGVATNCGVYKENQPVERALGWVGRNLRIRIPHATYYNLYGIERAGRLSGQRFLGDHDWYREGCEFLTQPGIQKEDGSWYESLGHHDQWPLISTSFALLFLSKGRTPVLVSKMVHGPGEDWNNDRNDARHLVEYASRELFHKLPMAWQIFDARRIEVQNNEQILSLVGELLQSPVVYFNGHEAPRFTAIEVKVLRQYVEQGGFILAEACCGRKEFDQGFRELMQELFPDTPLRKLPPEHPVWQAHAVVPPDSFPLEGIEYGCKTVVIYSPRDLSCHWEAAEDKKGTGQLAFRLGANILAYATGLEPPRPRLSPTEVVVDDPEGKLIPRGYLRIGQLRHEGDWQPAPNAMRNLLVGCRKQARLDVALQTKPIYANDPDLTEFRFLYMHGRGTFTVGPEGIKNLRNHLETGGTLFSDACCGRKAFDGAFRALVAQLYPGKSLEPIPVTDELYSKELTGTAIKTLRCRTDTKDNKEFRDIEPALEGIKVGNRWAVIYSKYDIGCALEKHQSTDCLGYDSTSALRLGVAAVLYALNH